MDSKRLKTKSLYYWIRQFNEQTIYDRDSRHIDEFSNYDSRRLSRRFWINYALELYSIANRYIEKKSFNVNLLLCIYINIGTEKIDNIQEWNNAYIKKEWTPPELYLYKIPISESFVIQPRRSENLSSVFHRDVYYSELDKEVYGQGVFCLYIRGNQTICR